MFENAIAEVRNYTRPILGATRQFNGALFPSSATMFFVNDEGVALTCKHVVPLFKAVNELGPKFQEFNKRVKDLPKDHTRANKISFIKKEFGYENDTVVEAALNLVHSFQGDSLTIHIESHPGTSIHHDLAIIRFEGYKEKSYLNHARFARDMTSVVPGKYMCRLGYPFIQYTNFEVNANNALEFTNKGTMYTPPFPIDGMVTRLIRDGQGVPSIELSSPGLKGQSGGPLFDVGGLVYGVQSITRHLNLDFSINKLSKDGKKTGEIDHRPHFHVGGCVHGDVIKEFMTSRGVKFTETD